jgi:hypothetical protein
MLRINTFTIIFNYSTFSYHYAIHICRYLHLAFLLSRSSFVYPIPSFVTFQLSFSYSICLKYTFNPFLFHYLFYFHFHYILYIFNISCIYWFFYTALTAMKLRNSAQCTLLVLINRTVLPIHVQVQYSYSDKIIKYAHIQ